MLNKRGPAPRSGLDATRQEAALIDAEINPPSGRPLRLHVSGDCKTRKAADVLSAACERWRNRGGGPVWTYTHSWRSIPRATWRGVSVLASVETITDAKRAMKRGYAAAIVVAEHPADGKAHRVDGVRVIPCPQQTRGTSCVDCGLCMKDSMLQSGSGVIAFAAHGAGTKRAKRALEVIS